jgi:broad specificity phosphatase PhoE
MDAGDRHAWQRDQDERPLSDLGQRQADAIAAALMEDYEIDALFASTALRARQTLEPLVSRFGLAVRIEPLLCETQLGESPETLGERGLRALWSIREIVGEGVAVAASHGDIIPATVGALDSSLRRVPADAATAQVWRSRWYEITLDERDIAVTLREAANFPL